MGWLSSAKFHCEEHISYQCTGNRANETGRDYCSEHSYGRVGRAVIIQCSERGGGGWGGGGGFRLRDDGGFRLRDDGGGGGRLGLGWSLFCRSSVIHLSLEGFFFGAVNGVETVIKAPTTRPTTVSSGIAIVTSNIDTSEDKLKNSDVDCEQTISAQNGAVTDANSVGSASSSLSPAEESTSGCW